MQLGGWKENFYLGYLGARMRCPDEILVILQLVVGLVVTWFHSRAPWGDELVDVSTLQDHSSSVICGSFRRACGQEILKHSTAHLCLRCVVLRSQFWIEMMRSCFQPFRRWGPKYLEKPIAKTYCTSVEDRGYIACSPVKYRRLTTVHTFMSFNICCWRPVPTIASKVLVLMAFWEQCSRWCWCPVIDMSLTQLWVCNTGSWPLGMKSFSPSTCIEFHGSGCQTSFCRSLIKTPVFFVATYQCYRHCPQVWCPAWFPQCLLLRESKTDLTCNPWPERSQNRLLRHSNASMP